MAPINANVVSVGGTAYVRAKESLPEVDTESSNGNGKHSKGYVISFNLKQYNIPKPGTVKDFVGMNVDNLYMI